jgi:hypothetical protein
MKRKHQGMVAVMFLIISLLVAGGYTLYGTWKPQPALPQKPPPPLPDVKVPGPATMQEIGRLAKEIKRLASPPLASVQAVDLGLFGYRPASRSGGVLLAGRRGEFVPFDYQLTLAFYSSQEQFCIIDGTFYRTGGVLPDGGRIVKIKPSKVLIKRKGVKRWVPLAERLVKSEQTTETPANQDNS